MAKKDISSMRTTLDFLKQEGELLTVKGEIDPVYEVSGLQKALEHGPALLFENIKGYPGTRNVGNVFAREERVAKIFDLSDPRKLKFRCLEAIKKPIPSKVVKDAPCQEVVITDNIDVMATLPIIKHTERDAGRIIGGGNTLLSGKYFQDGTHISFNRMHFRGKDWSSLYAVLGTHLGDTALIKHRGEKIPLTINICTPPTVLMVAATWFLHTIVPRGTDELAIAGGLQGFPVEICQAKTVDAYSIAESEWVIEGYIDTSQRVWESEEAEKTGQFGVHPFFPEWPGTLGRSHRVQKFQATAITHRRDNPIFFTPLAHSFEADIAGAPFREACFLELADRIVPDLVVDVNSLKGVAAWASHIIFQVKKKRARDEGLQRNILMGALGASQGLRLAMAVDEDIDIYSPEDVLWAILVRVNPSIDILTGIGGGMGERIFPTERVAGYHYEGGLAIDATVPFETKWNFERAHYPADRIDVRRWLSDAEISAIQAKQSEYAKILGRTGW